MDVEARARDDGEDGQDREARDELKPFARTSRSTQMLRGMRVERTSFAWELNALVKSLVAPVNHIHGRSAARRNTMYGSSPTSRENTTVKTNQ